MPKSDAVSYKSQCFYNAVLANPDLGILQYISKDADSTVKVYVSVHNIAANALDEAISVDDDDNTKITFLWDTASVGNDFLTVKINGDTDARAVKPIRIISGKLTSLTVSSSDTVSANYLGIARVVISDSTNVILRKESE
jgi:hypothetical protein